VKRPHAVIDGIRMAWVEQGEGAPVILLHGIPTSPDLWRKVMPRPKGVRALAWEMVGYGQSIPEGVGRNISVARRTEYLAALRSLRSRRSKANSLVSLAGNLKGYVFETS